eukprot:m.174877 g.174877  ORF g.174877 m.174877 type:complete len:86 (-) comp18340_c0_seq1:81-338(-)
MGWEPWVQAFVDGVTGRVMQIGIVHAGTAMVVLSIVMINFEELSAGYHRRNSGSTATDIPKVASKDGDETTTLLSVAAPRINDDA